MREQSEACAGAHDAEVRRRWRPSDKKVVEARAGGRYPYAGESWGQFVGRVAACRLRAGETQPRENVAVFTSATPTAVWTGLALDIGD